MDKFFEAVDIVCIGCAYSEETCESCPVRRKCDELRAAPDANVELPMDDVSDTERAAAIRVVCAVCGGSQGTCKTCPVHLTEAKSAAVAEKTE